jgi:hypothetical protein
MSENNGNGLKVFMFEWMAGYEGEIGVLVVEDGSMETVKAAWKEWFVERSYPEQGYDVEQEVERVTFEEVNVKVKGGMGRYWSTST